MDLLNVLANSGKVCAGIFGESGIDTPNMIINLVHWVYLGIQVVVPILLIIFGMIDLAKAITAQKEDEIKKAQAGLFKKIILAVIVFLVTSIVGIVMNIVGGQSEGNDQAEHENIWQCAKHFINGK